MKNYLLEQSESDYPGNFNYYDDKGFANSKFKFIGDFIPEGENADIKKFIEEKLILLLFVLQDLILEKIK